MDKKIYAIGPTGIPVSVVYMGWPRSKFLTNNVDWTRSIYSLNPSFWVGFESTTRISPVVIVSVRGFPVSLNTANIWNLSRATLPGPMRALVNTSFHSMNWAEGISG